MSAAMKACYGEERLVSIRDLVDIKSSCLIECPFAFFLVDNEMKMSVNPLKVVMMINRCQIMKVHPLEMALPHVFVQQ